MINRDEWLSAVKDAFEQPLPATDAVSLKEFGVAFKLSRTAAARRIEQLVETGRAEKTTKLQRRADGGVMRVVAYRLIKAKKAR